MAHAHIHGLRMNDKYVYEDEGITGYGVTGREQHSDWMVNKWSGRSDLPWCYRQLQLQYNPWFPRDNMLHMSWIGCIRYTGVTLVSTATQKAAVVDRQGRCAYYYLMQLFGRSLTYSSIRVVLHGALDALFCRVFKNFVPLNGYNQIYLADESEYTDCVIYEYGKCEVLVSSDVVGMRVWKTYPFYVVGHQDDLQADLCYLAYRTGIVWEVD